MGLQLSSNDQFDEAANLVFSDDEDNKGSGENK